MLKAGKDRLRRIAKYLNPGNLWHDRSVRTQVLATIGVINVLAATIGGAVWVLNTRSATRVEIDASLNIAQRFADLTIRDLDSQGRMELLSERLLQELRSLRHVRILLMADGKLTMLSPRASSGEDYKSRWAPKWFAILVGPKLSGRSIRVVSASHSDPIIVIGEPADEIAEAWREFSSLAIVWITLDVLIVVILYIVIGRVLDPLASLARGMRSLKGGRYATRLKPSRAREIALITDRFNALAQSLDAAREEKSQLYRELISTQEQVRREIAHELHDEAGACLFGLSANASSIRTFANLLNDERSTEIGEHVGEILGNAERLKVMNRTILKQLRPGPLGQVKLTQLIMELVSGLQRNHRETQILATIGQLANSYGEGVDLTLYRCIQEGITTTIRTGKAETIYLDVSERRLAGRGARKESRQILRLTLRCDGDGFPASKPQDLTLATMAERVRALGGSYTFRSPPMKGTTIRIDIPIKRAAAERALALS